MPFLPCRTVHAILPAHHHTRNRHARRKLGQVLGGARRRHARPMLIARTRRPEVSVPVLAVPARMHAVAVVAHVPLPQSCRRNCAHMPGCITIASPTRYALGSGSPTTFTSTSCRESKVHNIRLLYGRYLSQITRRPTHSARYALTLRSWPQPSASVSSRPAGRPTHRIASALFRAPRGPTLLQVPPAHAS